MTQPKNSAVKNSLLMTVRGIPRRGGALAILASVLVGLTLARFMRISPTAAIFVLSFGIVVAITILLRKTDYLLIAWIILTTFVWIIMTRFFPTYYSSVGRAIFWGLLGCAIVAWAVDNILRRRQFIPFDNMLVKAILIIFLLWGTMTLYTSQAVFLSVKKFSHIVIALIASYMFYDYFCRDQNNIKKLLRVVSLVFVVVSFVTIAVAFQGLMSGIPIYKQITLWFWNPNILGIFIFMGIPIALTSGFDFLRNRGLRIFLIAIMFLALYFSFHRSAWVAAAVSSLFLLLKSRMKVPAWVAIVAGLFLGALLLPVVGDDVYDYVTGPRYTGRIEIWKASWKTACNYPVLGTGPGTSLASIREYIETPWLRYSDTHSSYFKNAVEMGFPSVVIALTFYVIFFYYSSRIEKNLKSHYLRLVTRGAMATVLGLIVYDVFQNGFLMTCFDAAEFTVILPYILLAVPFAAKRLEESEKSG